MARKLYTADEVLRSLSRKNDCQISTHHRIIQILQPRQYNDLGNGSWGKIDFLTNVKNNQPYEILYVKKFLKDEELAKALYIKEKLEEIFVNSPHLSDNLRTL